MKSGTGKAIAVTLAGAAGGSAVTALGVMHNPLLIPEGLGITAMSLSNVPEIAKSAAATLKRNKFVRERKNEEEDPETGFKIISRTMTDEENMERVNPMFNALNNVEVRNNCSLCTATFELRHRGFDVMANLCGTGKELDAPTTWFQSARQKSITANGESKTDEKKYWSFGETPSKERTESLKNNTIKALLHQGSGARGDLSVKWVGGYGSGHSIAYRVKDNKVIFFDTQCNKKYSSDDFYFQNCANIYITRYDNCKINLDTIKEVAS